MVMGKWGRYCTPHSWIGGGCALAVSLAVAIRVGSPLSALHRLDAGDIVPPLWIMGTLWLLGMFAVGWSFGCLLGMRSGGPVQDALKYRGSTCMVLAVVLALLWYELLLCTLSLLLSWLCLAVATVTTVLAVLSWWRLCRPVACITGGFGVWLLWLLLLQLGVMLRA